MDEMQVPAPGAPDDDTIKKNGTPESGKHEPAQYQHQQAAHMAQRPQANGQTNVTMNTQQGPGIYTPPPLRQMPGYPPPNQAHYPMQPPRMYGYRQQGPYQNAYYPGAYPMYGRTPNTGKATASLVLGIISLVLAWLGFISIIALPCAIVGLILGIIARRELPPEHGRGTATAGMVCSIIGLVLALFVLLFTIFLYATIVNFADLPSYSV